MSMKDFENPAWGSAESHEQRYSSAPMPVISDKYSLRDRLDILNLLSLYGHLFDGGYRTAWLETIFAPPCGVDTCSPARRGGATRSASCGGEKKSKVGLRRPPVLTSSMWRSRAWIRTGPACSIVSRIIWHHRTETRVRQHCRQPVHPGSGIPACHPPSTISPSSGLKASWRRTPPAIGKLSIGTFSSWKCANEYYGVIG